MLKLTIGSVIGACLLSALAHGADAERPEQPALDPVLDAYAAPAQRVDIGSERSLNLRCSGAGKPTVVLEAGFGADSMAWVKLQPLLAKTMRVCAYDRAGYGFSDPGPLPRNMEVEVADLHALVHAANIAVPAIFVGHSIGSNIVRRYDQLHPGDVAALVLVDPPPQDVAAFSPTYAKAEAQMAPAMLQAYRLCGQAAKDGKLTAEPLAPELRSCLRPPNPAYSERLNAALRTYKSKPAFWDTILSGSEAKIGLFDAPVPPDEKHGDKPLIVLTALGAYAGVPADDRKALEAAQKRTHEALAASSRAGSRIDVPHTSHELQSDDPQAVLYAVLSAKKRLPRP